LHKHHKHVFGGQFALKSIVFSSIFSDIYFLVVAYFGNAYKNIQINPFASLQFHSQKANSILHIIAIQALSFIESSKQQ